MVKKALSRSQVPPVNMARAAAMRQHATPSEVALFRALSGGQLGVRIIRQVCIGRYIADLLAPSVRVIVEIDGPYHARRAAADARRERALVRAGYRIVRVSEEAVRRDLPQVLARIRAALESES